VVSVRLPDRLGNTSSTRRGMPVVEWEPHAREEAPCRWWREIIDQRRRGCLWCVHVPAIIGGPFTRGTRAQSLVGRGEEASAWALALARAFERGALL